VIDSIKDSCQVKEADGGGNLNESVEVVRRRREKGEIGDISSKFIPVNRSERVSQELLGKPPRRMKVKGTQHQMVVTDDTGTDTHFGDKMIALTRQDEIKSVTLVHGTALTGGANNVLLQTT
jgi:hypothetical protein